MASRFRRKVFEPRIYSPSKSASTISRECAEEFNDKTRLLDTDKLQHFLDLGAKVTAATHGRVSSETWLGMAQQGGPALSGMSDKGLESMAIIAQVMGGQRAGTAMSSVFQQFVGGRMWQMQGQELEKFGLVGHGHVQKGGHMTWSKEALDTPFTRAMREDPLKAAEIMQGAMSRGGITKTNDQVAELFRMLGRSTEVRLVADMLRNMPQMLAERGRLEGGLGVAASMTKQQAEDYTAVMHNFDAAWAEMMAHIGLPITKAAIPVMKEITRVFDAVAEFAKSNPDEIKKIATAFGWFSAVLIGAGVVALISAIGPVGWLVGGIGALIALKWDTFGPPLTAFVSAMASFAAISWDIFVVGFKGLVGFIKELVSIVGDGGSWLRNKLGISYEGGGDFGGGIIKASYGGAAESLSGGLGRGGGGGKYASRMQLLGRHGVTAPLGTGGYSGGDSFYDAIIRAEGTGKGGRDPYNTVLGYGAYGSPSKPLTSMTLEEAYAFGRTVRARHGSSSALGAFQIVGTTHEGRNGWRRVALGR